MTMFEESRVSRPSGLPIASSRRRLPPGVISSNLSTARKIIKSAGTASVSLTLPAIRIVPSVSTLNVKGLVTAAPARTRSSISTSGGRSTAVPTLGARIEIESARSRENSAPSNT
jgi:hypothetical protein